MDSEIIIKPHISKNSDDTGYKTGSFDVSFEDKTAIGVTYDEALGLLSAIMMPIERPCLFWLKTSEQQKAWDDNYNKITKK